MAWSFDHLERGVWPDRGFYNEELNTNTLRGRLAGKPLGNGWRGCYFGSRADAKARKEANFFPITTNRHFYARLAVRSNPSSRLTKWCATKILGTMRRTGSQQLATNGTFDTSSPHLIPKYLAGTCSLANYISVVFENKVLHCIVECGTACVNLYCSVLLQVVQFPGHHAYCVFGAWKRHMCWNDKRLATPQLIVSNWRFTWCSVASPVCNT